MVIQKPVLIVLIVLLGLVLSTSIITFLPSSTAPVTAEGKVETCDQSSNKKDVFSPNECVYINGTGLQKNKNYFVYIVKNITWAGDMDYSSYIVVGPITVKPDEQGNLPPTIIWEHPLPGYYDVIVDSSNNTRYDEGKDYIDDLDILGAGFFVIPEVPLGTISILLACFTAIFLKLRRLL